MEIATFANGCFWCTEAVFQRLKGVTKVTSGYTGGSIQNPTYEQVCSGSTGHTESLQIEFDSQVIPYETLLEVFFATHDSTTLNRQGNDVGTQYRSAIFYHTPEQKQAAETAKSKISEAVTEIVPAISFYPAENYHQDYYNLHKQAPYCSVVISPKIKKLLEKFGHLTKNPA